MSSSENQQQTPNPAPPSVSAGNHEMRDFYASQDASRPTSQPEPYLTPYLGLRARLSQTWINRWTILLLLVLIRTLFAIASLDDNLGSARRQALSACTAVENAGSAMASMPYYMSKGVNELTVKGVEKAINGLIQMLVMSVTGVQELALFIINLLTSTYVCLITLAVGGSLHVAVSVAEDVGDFLNSTIKDVGKEIGDAAGDLEGVINGFMKEIGKTGSFFSGKDPSPPKVDFTNEINKLNSLTLPADYDKGLSKLNDSIPTFDEVHNFTNTAIRMPFQEVQKLLNESLPRYTLDSSLFPVPAKEKLIFCSDDNGINDFFDKLVRIEHLAKKIFLGVLITLAILAMIPMAYREYRRWRFAQDRAKLIKTDAHDPMDAVYLASRPYTSTFGLTLAKRFKSPRRQALVRWSIAYATTVPALFVLSLAIAGLLGCLCQYILLKSIEKEVPALTNEVGAFADKVMYQLNNASEQWAVGTNKIISDTNEKINDDVFGWVNTTTHAVNHTLNVFVDGMVDTLNVTFGKTILYEPILDVLNCLVLLKIEGIQKALTWVSDHAHVDFPLMDANVFTAGANAKVSGSQNELLAQGPADGAADDIAATVLHVTNALYRAIRQEAIISTCVLIIWFIILFIGIARALVLMSKGGSEGTYRQPQTQDSPSQGHEKHELDEFFRSRGRVPTYEQATASPVSGDSSGNKYNGQSYTLTPAPLPILQVHSVTSPTIPGDAFSTSKSEKLGNVGSQSVDAAIRRPTHLRASSHGDYDVSSPASPPNLPSQTFSSNPPPPNQSTRDPFADPGR
jgi:hypothetical protein